MTEIKNQKFGVEIEMNSITRENASKVVAHLFGTDNAFYTGGGYRTWTAVDAKGRKWNFMRDGSISASCDEMKCEMVTPVLDYDDIELLQEVVRTLRNNGAKAHATCGIHVHVGADEHTPKSLRNLLNLTYTHYDLLERALQFTDRKNWCRKADASFINDINLNKPTTKTDLKCYWYGNDGHYYGKVSPSTAYNKSQQHYDYSRYQLLNLHSYFQNKGVEFRAFNSTLHAGEVKAYVQLCLALNVKAINSASVKVSPFSAIADEHETMRRWLKGLGLVGDEYKTCRLHLTRHLSKVTA